MSGQTYLYKYDVPCGICGTVRTGWRMSVPNTCPNNSEHEIDEENIIQIESIETPSTHTHSIAVPVPNTNVGEFPLDDNTIVRLTFDVPEEFLALESICVLGIPDTTSENADYDFYSNYYNPDNEEPYNQHAECSATNIYNVIQNNGIKIDISDVFSNISAGDSCGLRIVSNTGKLRPYMIRLSYYTQEPVEHEE